MTQPPEARMGNDIARQFGHLPPSEAAEVIAAHDDSLDPLVVDAAGRLATQA